MTRGADLLSNPDLLADARFVLATFRKRAGRPDVCFAGPRNEAWREDVMAALTKAARAPKKHFGSFQLTKCLTWSANLGFTVEAVAAVVLLNAGETI